jgi:hypothetical protein
MQAIAANFSPAGIFVAANPPAQTAKRLPSWVTWSNGKDAALVLCAIVASCVAVSNRREATTTHQKQEHEQELNERIDQRITANISPKLDDITSRLAKLEGWKDGIQAKVRVLGESQKQLRNKLTQQEAINRLENPRRILATIRAEIQTAEVNHLVLPASQLNDYRNAIRVLPSSAFEFWATVAAIINYQSLVNQMSGEAPNPSEVSRPCAGLTNSGNMKSYGNRFSYEVFTNCFVDLDTESFDNVTFKNSVIRYHGGEVHLRATRFINCSFLLDLSSVKAKPAKPALILALMESDQKTVKIN